MDKTGKEILDLIEKVDPADTAKLDEIDLNVAFFLEGKVRRLRTMNDIFDLDMRSVPSYTRSRDALKSIRPEGWFPSTMRAKPKDCFRCDIFRHPRGFDINSHFVSEAPTEELAELHAIIQAISHERAISGEGNAAE